MAVLRYAPAEGSLTRASMLPSGVYQLRPNRGKPVTLLNDGPPDRAGGVGGWETSDRMGSPPGRWFSGQAVETMSLPCILDRHEQKGHTTVEDRLSALYAMGRAGRHAHPPHIRVLGDIRPFDKRLTWIMQDISLGDRSMLEPGVIRQQHLTISLEGWYGIPHVTSASVKRTRNGSDKPKTHTIHTRAGDTLRAIAVRELGGSGRVSDIKSWNARFKRTDPDAPLRAGIKVLIK